MTDAEHHQFVSNPAWVTDIIARHWDNIERVVQADWLPKLSSARKLSKQAMRVDVKEYGCGAYGCAFPTLNKGVVLKITTDDTEAQFAASLAATLVEPICVEYYSSFSLPEKRGNRGVYLIWRESADEVGKLPDFISRHGGDGDRTSDLIHEQHKAAQVAYLTLHNSRDKKELAYAIDYWLMACNDMVQIPEMAEIAIGMQRIYAEQGIFFGDVHEGNVGLVHRQDGDHWVITDPGNIAVVR